VKEGKSGDSSNRDLSTKVIVAKADESIIWLFKAGILTSQKDILSKWIVDSGVKKVNSVTTRLQLFTLCIYLKKVNYL